MNTTLPYLTLLFYGLVFGLISLTMLAGALRETNPQLITADYEKAAGFFVLAVATSMFAVTLHATTTIGVGWYMWVGALVACGASGMLLLSDSFRASDRVFARVMANHYDRN